MPVCYLICFERPYRAKTGNKQKTARHYCGTTKDFDTRMKLHASGHGARLIDVIQKDGIGWQVVRLWEGGRDMEIKLKRRSFKDICPVCNAKLSHLKYQSAEA